MGAVRHHSWADDFYLPRLEKSCLLRGAESVTALNSPPRATQTPAQPTPEVAAVAQPLRYGAKPPRFRASDAVPVREQIVAYTLLVLGSLAFLIPFYFVVNGS